jgi:hypothetical protein
MDEGTPEEKHEDWTRRGITCGLDQGKRKQNMRTGQGERKYEDWTGGCWIGGRKHALSEIQRNELYFGQACSI